jgi:hypothetical protein
MRFCRDLTLKMRQQFKAPSYCLGGRAVHKAALWIITVITLLVSRSGLCAEPKLGDSIEEFSSAWGSPTQHERLVRTARLTWDWRESRPESIKPGVFAVEVAFLDRVACEIVVRSKHRMTRSKVAQLVEPLVPDVDAADFPKPKSDVNGIQIYELGDGSAVSVKKHRGHAVIVIMGLTFLRNNRVFDGEAAKVRPPTPNH